MRKRAGSAEKPGSKAADRQKQKETKRKQKKQMVFLITKRKQKNLIMIMSMTMKMLMTMIMVMVMKMVMGMWDTDHRWSETINSLACCKTEGCEDMTREETTKILAILKAAYPNSYKNMTQSEAIGVVGVWHMQFADVHPDIVMMALQKCISTCTFPPSISEVKKKISSIHWEASDMIREDSLILPELAQKAEWVYEQTKEYRYDSPQSPTLCAMLRSSDAARLLGN